MYRIYLNLAKVTTCYWLITCFIFQSFFLTLVCYPKNSIAEEVNQGNIVNPTPIENNPNSNPVEIPALPISLPINVENNNFTQILKSRNDVDIVNISTPNNSGFSVNNFTDFNINPQGLVVNNSTASQDKIIATQIAGLIEDNNNLKDSGSASLILFEVKGNDLSQLNGYLELAGKKADLIIANPNGIVVNGAGFINIGNLNLLVGNSKQNTANNDLQFNLNVNANDGSNSQSLINKLVLPDFFNKLMVIGSGIDLEKVSSAELVANSIKINAPIFGSSTNIINIRSSKDDFNFNDKTFIANQDSNQANNDSCIDGDLNCQESNSPTGYAIDASNLAKIQAGKIYIVANQEGFAVRWSGEMLAQNDGIKIDAKGNITNNKLIAQKGNIEINSQMGEIISQGEIQTKNTEDKINSNINLISSKDITILDSSRLISANNIGILTQRNFVNNAQNYSISANDFSINAQDFSNNSIIFSNNDLNINVKNFYNLANLIAQKNLQMTVLNSLENKAQIQANNNVSLTTFQFKNSDINSNINYKIFANNLLKLTLTNTPTDIDPVILSGTIISNKDLIITGRNLVNHASINATNDIEITDDAKFSNGDLTNVNSEIIAGNNLNISASKNIDNLGLLSAKNNLTINSQTGNINNLGDAKIIGAAGITTLNAMAGDINQESTKSLIANAILNINSLNFTNNSARVDAVGKITFNIANDLINKIKSTIYSASNIEFNVVNNLENLDDSVIYGKNNLIIQKYSNSNPLFNVSDNKIASVKNSSSEIIAFEGSLDVNAKKLENIRAIKPAIALIEGENFIDGTSLLDNHELYNWIEDSTLCANDQCETGVTKYRSTIPLNANSKISSISASSILTINANEILNEASNIITKGNLNINAQIFNNNSLNYYGKIYQKTLDSNGEIIANNYFDNPDSDKNYSALTRYKVDLQKNIIQDLSNTSIQKASSNFLSKTSEVSINTNPQTISIIDLNKFLDDVLNLSIVEKSVNNLAPLIENRIEFTDRKILYDILYPIIPDQDIINNNASGLSDNPNKIIELNKETLVIKEIEKESDRQIRNLTGDQFNQLNNFAHELANIEKNNLLLSNITNSLSNQTYANNLFFLPNSSTNFANNNLKNSQNNIASNNTNSSSIKNFNPTKELAKNNLKNSSIAQILNNNSQGKIANEKIAKEKIYYEKQNISNETNIAEANIANEANIAETNIASNESIANTETQNPTQLANDEEIVELAKNQESGEESNSINNTTSEILVSNDRNQVLSITNDIKKTIMNLNGSTIRKALANSATPIIATGSKISKVIIDKTFGSSKFNAINNGIKIQSKIKQNGDEELKTQLLKIIPKQNIEQDTSSLMNSENNSSPLMVN